MHIWVHTPEPKRASFYIVLYYGCENRNSELDANAPGRDGVVHDRHRDTIASARNGHSWTSLAGPSKDLDKNFSERKGAQDSLQDARERLAVLLDARAAVGLGRHPTIPPLEDRHAPNPRCPQWTVPLPSSYRR